MKTVIEMALSVVPEEDREDAHGYKLLRLTYSEIERFAELVRADERKVEQAEHEADKVIIEYHEATIKRLEAKIIAEREALETLYADAQFIFNNPPGETSQEVRDVIEWYASAIRARGQK